jgi:hypothetical protein
MKSVPADRRRGRGKSGKKALLHSDAVNIRERRVKSAGVSLNPGRGQFRHPASLLSGPRVENQGRHLPLLPVMTDAGSRGVSRREIVLPGPGAAVKVNRKVPAFADTVILLDRGVNPQGRINPGAAASGVPGRNLLVEKALREAIQEGRSRSER